jgi:hypothetical protein
MPSLHDDEKVFEHASYGLIGFSRVTHGGAKRLFGSALTEHHTTMRLSISHGKRAHSLSRDWYRDTTNANGVREYIEIELSAAQFAELLTTHNMGVGVPCTILRVAGQRIADPPEELLEVEQVREGFKEEAEKLGKKMHSFSQLMSNIFAKAASVTKTDKSTLESAYAQIIQHVESNLPFVLDSFHEAADKIVSHAKAEVDAFMTHAVVLAGIKAIHDGTAQTPQLPQRKEGEDGPV